MRFRDDVVEIDQAEPAAPTVPAPAGAIRRPQPGPSPANVEDELEVIAALHRIHADLGEPIDVALDGPAVRVTATGLTRARDEEVRSALEHLSRVALHLEHPEAEPMKTTESTRPDSASARRSELGARLGEETVDRILDDSEAVMARAFALRTLARRFPPDIETQLSLTSRGVLAALRDEHRAALDTHLRELEHALAAVLPPSPPVSSPPANNWQAAAVRTLAAAQRVDQLLSGLFAASGEPSSLSSLAESLRALDAEKRP
jgi:hypothetical protein